MAVYVDILRSCGYANAGCFGNRVKSSCHMIADTKEELETMRIALKLKPDWIHNEHYDLTPNKRNAAVRLGAVEVETTVEYVRLLRAIRDRIQEEIW